MGKFEDEIKKKLNEGNIEYSPSSWEGMEKKLSEKPSFTEFEKKMQDTISGGSIPVPAGSWNSFSEKTNLLNEFENSLSDKINDGQIELNQNHWEDFSEKLSNSSLTSYEKTVKETLNTGEIAYKKAHWKAFEKMLHGNRSNKKILWRSAAALLLLISIGVGVNQISNEETISTNVNSSSKDVDVPVKKAFTKTMESPVNKVIPNQNSPYELTIYKGYDEKKTVNTSNHLNNNHLGIDSVLTDIIIEKKNNKKLSLLPSISVDAKKSLFASFELINQHVYNKVKNNPINSLHPGATLWLNFWENPALTGFYGKHTISGYCYIDWDLIDENKNQIGEFYFVQPIVQIGAYERRLNNNWAIGGYIKNQLMKNWNIQEYAMSVSYTKQLFNGYNFSFGAGANLRSQNLAVNKLTLREKAINSNYIFTTELGSIKSKEEYSSTYHVGGFVNNQHFFIGYTAFNFGFNQLTNDNDVFLTKHRVTGGVHSPTYRKFQASGLLRFEQELFTSYSPAVGLSYDGKIFTMFEYENLSGKRITLGYQMKKGIKAQLNYSIKDIEDYKSNELNLDNFTERRGYISAGLNYIF